MSQYKTPDLLADIKRRRIDWLGYTIRMDQTRMAKNIFESKLEEQ
jgi:hypothetical protein